jgi:hypothetical protein
VTRKPVFRPQADQEVQSARQWYEEQRPGLGIEFANSIDEVVERISSNPLSERHRSDNRLYRGCAKHVRKVQAWQPIRPGRSDLT